MATRTVAAGGGNWNTPATWQEGIVPTAADDVVTNGTSSGTLTVDASLTCACRSLTIANSVALTFAASSTVNIGDASGGVLNLTGSGAVTVSGGQINMVSTSSNGGAGWGVTSAGNTLTAIAFNGVGGKWVLQDALTVTGRQITLTSGSFFGNAKSIACGVFASTGTNTRTLDITNCSVTCTAGSGTNGWSFALANGLTFVATGSTITLSAASVTLNHASGNGSLGSFGTVVFSGSGQAVVNASATFVNLTRTGTASKSDSFVPGQNIDITVTGTLTLGGNTVQGVNRLGVWPINGTPGTLRTIACAGAAVVISGDVDFMDIAISGSPSWTNAGSAFVGDALGNGALIVSNRTAPATQTHTASAGGNWSDVTKWTSRVPLPQDNVIVNASTTGTLTGDMPRLGANLTFTGFVGTLSITVNAMVLGSLAYGTGMTGPGSFALQLFGRGGNTITTNGVVTGSGIEIWAGSYTLQDALTMSSGGNVFRVSTGGTFISNNFSMAVPGFDINSATATVTLGTSSITTSLGMTITSAATVSAASASLTLSTLAGFAAVGATRTIALAGKSIGSITYGAASTDVRSGLLAFTGGGTIGTLAIGSGRAVTFSSTSTYTITSAFNANGTSNGYLYLPAVSGNYASIPDSAALSPTGDMTLLTRVALDDWTPTNGVGLLSKYTGVAATTSFMLYVHTTGAPRLYHSDGASINLITATAVPVIADGATLWVLVSRRNSDGRVQFFTASGAIANPVASDFTQLGADVVLAAGVSMADTATEVEVGAYNGGVAVTNNSGQYYRAQIYNGVFSTAAFSGTKQLDVDFTKKLVGANTFIESSVNAATVTVNGTLAQVGDGRVAIASSTGASAATISYAGPQQLNLDYVTLQDITASGAAAAFIAYGQSGANVSGNTGWTFANLRVIVDAGGNWSAAGTWMEGIVPTAADRVRARATSGALVVTAASVCCSMDLTGYTGTMSGSGDLTIGDASGGACTLAGTISGTWTTTFVTTSTNGTVGWGITSNGKTFPGNVTINGSGGKLVCQDAFSCGAATLGLTTGSFFGNAKNITIGQISSNNGNTRTLDITGCTVAVSLGGTSWNFRTSGGATVVATGSTITMSGASANFLHGDASGAAGTYGTVVFTGSGSNQAGGPSASGITFVNLTVTGTAARIDNFSVIAGGITVTGTLTIGGNSTQGVNRLLVQSNTVGTQRSIVATGAAVVINGDVDFMDVTITGSPSWTNAGAAFVGDAGGNGSLITTNRTTPATQTRAGAGGNWSGATWTSRVPLPQDNVIVGAGASGTITADMPRLGADVDFTGFAGTFSVSAAFSSFGSWTNGSAMSFANGSNITLAGRGSHTITSNGKTIGSSSNVAIGGPGGTYTLQDAVSVTTNSLSVSDGTFTTNNQSATCGTFSAESARTVVLNLGTSIFTLMTTATTNAWSTTTSFTTLNGSTSTIVIAAAGTNTRTIRWGSTGTQLGTVTYTVANSPGTLLIHNAAQARTLAALNVGSGRGLTVFAGATITITSAFNVNGVANGYLYFPGVAGNYASLPANGSLAISGTTIDIRGRASSDDWTPAIEAALVCNYHGATQAQRPFLLRLTTGGNLKLYNNISSSWTSTVAVPFADGATGWVRVTFDWSTGTAKFYTSTDATNDYTAVVWTQLGADVVSTSGSVATFTATPTIIGTYTSDNPVSNFWIGKVYRIAVLNGIGGPSIIDVDFTRSLASSGWLDAAKTQFTESSVNAATVTINGTLAQVGDGRVVLNSSTPGSAATLSKASGVVTGAFLSIKDSTATGGALWEAMGSSANVSGNTGWIFNAASRTATDSATATDSVSSVLNRGRTTSDSVPLSDAATRAALGLARTGSDSVVLTDVAMPGRVSARTTSDVVTLTDTAAAASGGSRSCTDSVLVSDVVIRGVLVGRQASDSVTLSDVAVRSVLHYARAATDSVQLLDVASPTSTHHTSAVDTVILADVAIATTGKNRTAHDSVAVSDVASEIGIRPRIALDSVALVDVAGGVLRFIRVCVDTVATSDHAVGGVIPRRFYQVSLVSKNPFIGWHVLEAAV